MSEQAVVKTVNLTKKYGDLTALDNLSIELEQGRILGFIGPNGAGKTTTIKILVGLARATSGQAWVAGYDCLGDTKKIRQLVGYMPDTFGAYDNMRVREYLDFFGAAFSLGRSVRQKRIDQTMDIAGCTYMRDMFVESLSHGMKQRVAIARTLLHDPQVLIMDEPANGLDPNARIEMRTILLRLAEMGKTLIVTSHILPELSRICDIVAIITKGKLRAFGTLDEIMRRVKQRRTVEVQLLSTDAVAMVTEVLKTKLEPDAEIHPSEAEAMVRFETSRDEHELADLLSTLSQNVSGVSQFREVPADLEDAFMSVTAADRAREASGEEAAV